MTGEHFVVRASRTLVALYLRHLRDEYGADMVALVSDQCRDEPARRVCVRLVIDVAITVPKAHLEARMHRTPNPVVPINYMAVALGGALIAIVGGSQFMTVVIGLAIDHAHLNLPSSARRAQVGNFGERDHHRARCRRSRRRRLATVRFSRRAEPGGCVVEVPPRRSLARGSGDPGRRSGRRQLVLGMAAVLTAFVLTGVGVVLGAMRFAGRSRPITS